MTSRKALPVVAAALLFLCLHAFAVPRTLEDEDSVNFAFGVESFDVTHYAPHPPGYPVYILAARASTAVVGWARPEWRRVRVAAAGLAWVSIVSGALGILAFAAWWRGLGLTHGWSVAAAVGTAAAPLYWFTAARPMSDMPGLVAAIAVQAAIFNGRSRLEAARATPASWIWGAALAGVAIGVRSQTMWLTMPVCAWAFVQLSRRGLWRGAAAMAAAAAAGIAVWFIPLVRDAGGFDKYYEAARGLARMDFACVPMLATHWSWAVLGDGLRETFVAPWNLAGPWLVIGLAALGLLRLYAAGAARAGLLLLAVGPYLLFHLLFQEVETIRYALPVASVMAGLAVKGIRVAGRPAMLGAIALAAAWVALVQPVTSAYAEGWPAFRVVMRMRDTRAAMENRPVLAAHARAWGAASRALDWLRGYWDVTPPPLVRSDETLRVVRYWIAGGMAPVWFLSDPNRSDLLRFDAQSARFEGTASLPSEAASLIGRARPIELGWWRLERPRWMLGSGWSMTDDLAREGGGPAMVYLRRGAGDALVGVSVTPARGHQTIRVTARLDGIAIGEWVVGELTDGFRWLAIPARQLEGAGPYAQLVIAPVAPNAAVFDQAVVSMGDAPAVAFGHGWSSPLIDQSGSIARLAGANARLEVRYHGRPVRLTLRGTVPGDFALPPIVAITAGRGLHRTFVPSRTFEIIVDLLPEVLDQSGGSVGIETDLRRTLAERRRGLHPREWGVKVTSVTVAAIDNS